METKTFPHTYNKAVFDERAAAVKALLEDKVPPTTIIALRARVEKLETMLGVRTAVTK